ncbi:NAD(P)/FAD-dependent oxidoreductase [Marinicrinis lubricantis]|uniref:NAD(P)/FAD-dependent oxidoreductase n=1 Tax=Marinicrinis lubricantis TaxID=2086470 RepID=A0ABW1IQ03_9BACL
MRSSVVEMEMKEGGALMLYDAVIIGGGIAGLQASIQLGRYGHRVLVLDKGTGRSELCRKYRNILGYPMGVSGPELRERGRAQAEQYDVTFVNQKAVMLKQQDEFEVITDTQERYRGMTVLISTGVGDRIPDIPGMMDCLGESIYICPDCDGYEVMNRHVIIIGSGNAGASMTSELSYFSDQLTYVNHERQPIDAKLEKELASLKARVVHAPVIRVNSTAGQFHSVELAGGKQLEGEKAFIAFGGNEVRTQLARQAGAEVAENGHIITDPRTKMTSVEGIWAAGDVGLHSEQAVIAMGEGAQAAIWMHKRLMKLGLKTSRELVLST